MDERAAAWNALAAVVAYPGDGWTAAIAACAGGAAGDAAAAEALAAFARDVASLPLRRAQQIYVDAFDLDPDCALDLGWHLVGDGPDRGVFLSFVREALARAGVAETGELPDHLPHLLMLIGREPETEAADMARLIAPAVARVADALTRRANPYAHLLHAIHRRLAVAGSREEVHRE